MMIRHYLTVALRKIIKKGTVSFINLLGLTIGISSAILILLWVNDEVHFDKLHKNYEDIYRTEDRNNRIFGFFTILAILISCLGLLGLTLLSALQKTKEISIRKVNGASIRNLIFMLNIGFLKLIALAFLISVPIAFYTSQKLLQTFSYRMSISWWIFISAGIAVMLIAILTVSYRSWSIAKTNPVEGLKYE